MSENISCWWKRDDDGAYHTECGNLFEFTTGDIDGNKFKFCPWCGAILINKPNEN